MRASDAFALVAVSPARNSGRRRAWGVRASAALAMVATLLAGACSTPRAGGADPATDASGAGPDPDRPVVQVPEARTPLPFLDPDASPRTDLGRLRAQYLPVWTADFDWAFPPEACGTAWELDGIAEPTTTGDPAVLGDFATAAALSVMRYEHQFSRALAEPSPPAQLCVATAAVGPARTGALEVLSSYLEPGARRAEPAAHPEEVRIVGAGPAAAMAVACVTPGYPTVVSSSGEVIDAPTAPARLQAYHLRLSRGLEDRVTDLSLRVSQAAHREAEDCTELDGWALEWTGQVQAWISEGQVWETMDAVVTAAGVCEQPPPGGPDECPRDWSR